MWPRLCLSPPFETGLSLLKPEAHPAGLLPATGGAATGARPLGAMQGVGRFLPLRQVSSLLPSDHRGQCCPWLPSSPGRVETIL